MKVKDIERVIFTPGLGRESLTSDYYAVDNMVIVGATGSGKTTTTQAIVKSIIDSNEPDHYSLVYIDMKSHDSNPMCNTNRIIPTMTLMKYLKESPLEWDYKERVVQFVRHLTLLTWWASRDITGDPDAISMPAKCLIVVIEEFELLPLLERTLVLTMMKACPCVKFILSSQNSYCFRDYMDLFEYRIVTRAADALTSDDILGCNLGYKKADEYGSCWFYCGTTPGVYKKYRVKATPASLLNRLMKAQSGYSGQVNPVVLDDAWYQDNKELVSEYFRSYVGADFGIFDAYIHKELYTSAHGGEVDE